MSLVLDPFCFFNQDTSNVNKVQSARAKNFQHPSSATVTPSVLPRSNRGSFYMRRLCNAQRLPVRRRAAGMEPEPGTCVGALRSWTSLQRGGTAFKYTRLLLSVRLRICPSTSQSYDQPDETTHR